MPEGHVIHRIARDQTGDLAGSRLRVTSPQGRAAASAERLDGQVLERIDAHGKHLFYRFEREDTLHVHLGLYGKYRRFRPPPPVPRDTVRIRFASTDWVIDLTGPSACGLVDPQEEAEILARLGPDPIHQDADPDVVWERLKRRRIGVGAALLDQRVLAGVGNVYRAEVLFAHGIDPRRPAATLTREEFDRFWETITRMLRQGVKDGRIVTVDPAERGTPRARTRRREAVYVYGRDACGSCGTPVERFQLGARWAYRCPSCQPTFDGVP